MKTPKVSIITPTYQREAHLPGAYQNFIRQDYPNLEWLILDDSPKPSRFLLGLNDPRVRYEHSTERKSIGNKRNRLIAMSKGSVVAHFDDDDFYDRTYLSEMLSRIDGGLDLVKLSGWHLYGIQQKVLAYWNLAQKYGFHYMVWGRRAVAATYWKPKETRRVLPDVWGYGFSYVFRKKVWEKIPFEDRNMNEDVLFARKASKLFKGGHFSDDKGLCCHIVHRANVSACFPQWILPSFTARRLFDPAVGPYLKNPALRFGAADLRLNMKID